MIFNKLIEKAIIPKYQTKGSVGLDLHSTDYTVIYPGKSKIIPTGLSINLEPGVEAQIRSRSGLAAKNNVFVLNSPGTVDSDYKGEIKVVLYNAGEQEFYVQAGDRIAQLVLARVHIEQDLVLDNIREDKGFGSTGL